MDEYKPNSHKYREEQAKKAVLPEKKPKKVVTGEVVTVKKSGLQKFAESLIADGIDNIQDFIVKEVVIPKAKEMVCGIADNVADGFKNCVHKLVYGDDSPNHSGNNRVQYGSCYGDNHRRVQTVSYKEVDFKYEDFIFRTRGDAEATLSELRDNIAQFKMTSVADFYSCVDRDDVTRDIDNNYVWTDLRNAKVQMTRGGYILKMPKPVYLDD